MLADDDSVATRFVIAAPAAESDLETGALPDDERDVASARSTHRAPVGRWVFLLFGLLVLAEGVLRGARRPAQ